MTDTNTPTAGRGYRLRNVLLLMPIVVVGAGLYYAIEAALAGGNSGQIEKVVLAKIPALLVFGLILGGPYIFSNVQLQPPHWLNWQTLLCSSYLGAVLFAPIFLIATQDFLHQMLGAGFGFAISEEPLRRLLLGALEGLLWGGVIGLWICAIDVRATHFTRKGVARYVTLYLLPVLVLTIPSLIFGTFWISIVMLCLGAMLSSMWRRNTKIDGGLQQSNAGKS